MSSPCRIKLRLVDFYRTIIFSLIYRLFYWIQFLFDSVSFHEAYSSQHILWLQLGVRCCRNNAGIYTEFFFFYKKIQARINYFIYDVNFFLNFNSLISFYLMVDVLASLNATSTFSIYHWIVWNQWFTFCAEILIWNKIFLICFISFTNVWMS